MKRLTCRAASRAADFLAVVVVAAFFDFAARIDTALADFHSADEDY